MTLLTTLTTNPILLYYLFILTWSISTLFGLALYTRKNRVLFK